jgi:hypothetical protein
MARSKKKKREERQYASSKERAMTRGSGFESTTVKLPEGVKFFQVKSAKPYKMDILPYEVKKGKDEKGGNPFSDSGFLHYERTFFVHRGIGAESNSYCCLQKTFGKKCPICRDVAKMRRQADSDQETIDSLKPKERQLFLVIDKNDEESGVQLWDVSYHLFGKMLDEKIKSAEDDDNYEDFYHLEGGMYLRVSFKEKSWSGNTFYETTNIEMKPRKEDIPEEILDDLPDLDDLLVEMDYDELEKVYLQDDDEDDKPKSKKGGKKVEDDDEDDEDDIDDEDEDIDDEEEDADEDEVKPKKKPAKKTPPKKKPAKKAAEEEDDDEDDDEDDEDDDDEGGDDDEDSDDDADDDVDDEWEEDEDEEEEEPVKPAKKGRGKKK